jgi:aryl-alcohol dehydrogenase-like predicted oxidoreductase
LQSVARTVLRSVPALRRIARRNASSFYEPPRFDAQAAREGLERSLAAVRRDVVDVFLLHDCNADALRDPDLLGTLEDLRWRGRIRSFGTAATFENTLGMINAHPDFCRIVQFDSDALSERVGRLPPNLGATVITHSVLTRSLRVIGSALRTDADMSARWSAELDANLADTGVLAQLLIRLALRENPRGVVLLHSNSPQHVRANAEATGVAADSGRIERLAVLIRARFAPTSPDHHAGLPQAKARP